MRTVKLLGCCAAFLGLVGAAPEPQNIKIGAWSFHTLVDPMSDASRGIAATSVSEIVTLVVKCDDNGNNTVYLDFISSKFLGALGDRHMRPVKYRLDDGPPTTVDAYYDKTSATVLSVKAGTDGARFFSNLSRAQKLVAQVSTYEGETYTSVIDVTGAHEALQKVAVTCKDNAAAALL